VSKTSKPLAPECVCVNQGHPTIHTKDRSRTGSSAASATHGRTQHTV
jgi:hypothetical protein